MSSNQFRLSATGEVMISRDLEVVTKHLLSAPQLVGGGAFPMANGRSLVAAQRVGNMIGLRSSPQSKVVEDGEVTINLPDHVTWTVRTYARKGLLRNTRIEPSQLRFTSVLDLAFARTNTGTRVGLSYRIEPTSHIVSRDPYLATIETLRQNMDELLRRLKERIEFATPIP